MRAACNDYLTACNDYLTGQAVPAPAPPAEFAHSYTYQAGHPAWSQPFVPPPWVHMQQAAGGWGTLNL